MLAEYVYLGDQLLAMIKPGEAVYYFHNDHLGTPQVLTNDSQAIAWKAVYTPFGQAVTSIQTVENPFRFPGQYYDQETGLHYNYFRYYDPTTGRYVTPDPIGLEGGINLFVYVAGNPLRWVDPFGLQTSPVPGPLRGPDAGAWQGGYYGSRRGTPGQYYPHTGIDQLAPAGATAVAPISGAISPSGTEAVMVCRQIGTICCNGVETPRMQCFRVVHINPTVTSGNVTEGSPVGTVLAQNAPVPSHSHTEYYETTCVNGNPTLTRGDPTPFFYPMPY
jgi:RHS repeat-associated protein